MNEDMQGGSIYGKGRKGQVMDVACVDSKSLCSKIINELENTGIPKIEVYTLDGKRRVLTDSEKIDFIGTISNKKELVAKEYLIASRAHNDFMNEIRMILKLQTFMKKDLNTLTTIGTLQNNIIGFSIKSKYFTFFKKCGENVYNLFHSIHKRDVNMMINHILSTLIHLNKYMFHMDLKLNNIIWCDSTQRFTMIDWEKSVEKDVLRKLSLTHGKTVYPTTWRVSPILVYIHRGRKIYSIEYSTAVLYTWINYRHNFKISYTDAQQMHEFLDEKVVTPMHTMIEETEYSDEQLYDKYCDTFDLYAFGISLLILCVCKKLSKTYFEFIESIMNVSHPNFAMNPTQALANYKRFLGKSRYTLRKKRY